MWRAPATVGAALLALLLPPVLEAKVNDTANGTCTSATCQDPDYVWLGEQPPVVETAAPGSAGAACIRDRAALPASWRPSLKLEADLHAQEAKYDNLTKVVNAAARDAFMEIEALTHRPSIVNELRTDLLEAVIIGAFPGSDPDVRSAALAAGKNVLLELATPYLAEPGYKALCQDMKIGADSGGDLALLVQFSRYLQMHTTRNPHWDRVQARLTALVRDALDDCGSIGALLGFDPSHRLGPGLDKLDLTQVLNERLTSQIFDMTLQGMFLLGLLAVPGVTMPDGTFEYFVSLWRFLERYPYPYAGQAGVTSKGDAFVNNAYIATHVVWIMSGLQRYRLDTTDVPAVVRFHRENFYAALDGGSIDLIAEFVDTFRQLNCTEENDVQTRDGVLFILNERDRAGGRFMQIPNLDEKVSEMSEYSKFHKALTAFFGLRRRVHEQPKEGTPGAVARALAARVAALDAAVEPS